MSRKIRRFGKYRATVVNNLDPQGLARLQLLVPDVHGIVPAPWAMPCAPVAGRVPTHSRHSASLM